MYTHADKKEAEPLLTEYNEIEHVRKIPNTTGTHYITGLFAGHRLRSITVRVCDNHVHTHRGRHRNV